MNGFNKKRGIRRQKFSSKEFLSNGLFTYIYIYIKKIIVTNTK